MSVLLVAAVLFANICYGQVSQKTIVVQGKAKLRVQPDIALITFSIEKSDTSQAKAMAKTNQLLDALTTALAQYGVEAQQLKIANYSIEAEQRYNSRIIEYSVANSLVATIRLNGKQINEMLKNIEARKLNGVEISFDYKLSDSLEKVMRTQLVQSAIADAKANAENIGKALNIQLRSILTVTKDGGEPSFHFY